MEHGEIKKMMRERVEVDFKNWYVGNSDPEDLKRHKQMLERQYFKGPFWESKKHKLFRKGKTQAFGDELPRRCS